MQPLQIILQQGNIGSVCLEATSSEDFLRLAKAVMHANRNGGRVHEVHLSAATNYGVERSGARHPGNFVWLREHHRGLAG